MSSWYLVPYLWTAATTGLQMTDTWQDSEIADSPLPFLAMTPLGGAPGRRPARSGVVSREAVVGHPADLADRELLRLSLRVPGRLHPGRAHEGAAVHRQTDRIAAGDSRCADRGVRHARTAAQTRDHRAHRSGRPGRLRAGRLGG